LTELPCNINKKVIREAYNNIRKHIHRTPVLTSQNLDSIVGASLFFKCENFQKAGAFKSRGAVNAVFSLEDNQLVNGVATHSSGNHAAALSRAAQLRKTKAYIVMPENSSKVKIEAVKNYDGIITFCKPTLQERENTLGKIIDNTGALEIHPYNDVRIIAGQATAAMELFEDINDLDIIMAPVGGGGLISGTALAAHFFSPRTKIIATEPEGAKDTFLSFYGKTFVPSINPETIADGLLTSLGSLTYPIIKEHVDQIVTVYEESIIKAMKLIWERMKIIIEPSSAVPIAALIQGKVPADNKNFNFKGKRIGIIISGGNLDPDNLPWQSIS
jgi:threonine dehydratase